MKRRSFVAGVVAVCLLWSGVSYGRPYGIVVSEETRGISEWAQVVDALQAKYDGRVFTYSADVWEVLDGLSAYAPTHVAFVSQPLEATDVFVGEVHRLTRALDDDPYGDAIWGIVTGYTAEDALRIVSISGFRVRKVLAGTSAAWLPYVQEGIATSESTYNKMWVKMPDGTVVDTLQCPTDRTTFLVDHLNTNTFDMMITSGHGQTRKWQLHYPDVGQEGFFMSAFGQVYGHPYAEPDVDIVSTNPKIYFGLGNCYIGKITNEHSMAPAWIHTGGAVLYTGYVIPEGRDSYQLGGIPAYFFIQDRTTWPEGFYLNNQALLFDLENKTPGTNPPDRDGAVLYGDPGLDARVEPVRPPLYDKTVTVASGGERDTVTVRIRMNEEGSPGFTGKWGNRHPIVLLPFRVKDVRIEFTDAYKAEVTDNFVLMYIWKKEDAPLQKGEQRSVTFTAKRVAPVTEVEEQLVSMTSSPQAFELCQNTPNPFNQATAIRYRLSTSARVDMRIYDVQGGLVRTLVDGTQEPGQHILRWDGQNKDGKNVASGVYFCRLRVGEEGRMRTRKMVLIR
ncbi:MAG: T9SS type A sorting domain-containing protein [Candidatus Latescibacteria bacterium]|nr:T9SS type A sorting domain-containing protein [Candidatus Latescibacterota bacterium]